VPTLDPDECRRQFAAARRAVLAGAGTDGRPLLVPVVVAVVSGDPGEDWIVTVVDAKPKTTTALRRLSVVRENPQVAFLVDEYDEDWDRLWWVRADATARVVEDGADHDRAVAALRDRYPRYRDTPPTGPAILARVVRWAGWTAVTGRAGPPPTADSWT
jgi:PPOX class probable F420-dependent enzyme